MSSIETSLTRQDLWQMVNAIMDSQSVSTESGRPVIINSLESQAFLQNTVKSFSCDFLKSENLKMFTAFKLLIETLEASGEVFDESAREVKVAKSKKYIVSPNLGPYIEIK